MDSFAYSLASALVHKERLHQDNLWGEQNHNNFIWNTIFGEEVGEVAEAVLENEYSNGVGHNNDHVAAEIIQCIAVGFVWLECLQRHGDIQLENLTVR